MSVAFDVQELRRDDLVVASGPKLLGEEMPVTVVVSYAGAPGSSHASFKNSP